MYILRDERGSGKTHQLIKMADNYNGHIVVDKLETADKIFRMAKEMGLKINKPLTYRELKCGINGKVVRGNIYIDNFEHYLNYTNATDGTISIVTTSLGVDSIERKEKGYTTEEASKLCNGIAINGDLKLGGDIDFKGTITSTDKKSKLVSIKENGETCMMVNLYNIKSIFKIVSNTSDERMLKNRHALTYKDGQEESIKIMVSQNTATFITRLMIREGLCI